MIAHVTDQLISSKTIDDLITYLFDGRDHALTTEMKSWLATSRRFTTFVTTFRDKIRKKLRVRQDQASLLDLRLELETAYLLLQEKSLSVVYEPQLGGVRAPDFVVSFTTSLTFTVEVTRMQVQATSSSSIGDQLADTICSKLGQLLHQQSNVIIVGADIPNLTQNDLQATMLRIQQRAERNDSTFWGRYGFRDRSDFMRHYQRLSEVLVRGSNLQDQALVAWINSQAKNPLPGKVRTALYRSHTK
jgi:hypothetical protein